MMQRRNLTLHKVIKFGHPGLFSMTCFFSVSAISLYSPHCRSPNNIQLYFLALLYNADCCKEHLAKCPSPKLSLWLSDLTHILLTFLSLYLFTQSQLKYQSICHIFFHLKIQNTFKLSQQIRQEFCRRQLHLSKPDPFQRSSAQSKVMVLLGEKKRITHYNSFAIRMD